jgi:hypothetical protein
MKKWEIRVMKTCPVCITSRGAGVMIAAFLSVLTPSSAWAGKPVTWYVGMTNAADNRASGTSVNTPLATIAFAIVVCAGGGDTISIDGGAAGFEYVQTGTLAIDKRLTIKGTGAELPLISGGGCATFTIIQNLKSNNLTIQNVTIDGGCPVMGLGGGIYNSATLTLIGVTVYGNKAGLGGGIYNDASGSLTIVGSKILNNSASGVSGGQCSLGGGVTGFGGGLYNVGTVTLSNVTVSSNTAASTGCNLGAGIFNTNAGTIHVIGSTISNNSARIVSTAAASGGGTFNFDGKVFLDSTVVSGNAAVQRRRGHC